MKKIFKILTITAICIAYCFLLYSGVISQTKYRGDLRGDRIILEVKTKTALCAPYTAVTWDTTAIRVFNTQILTGDHLTVDSLLNTLSTRNSAWGLRGRVYGPHATNNCTLTVYGSYLTDWYYSTSDYTAGSEAIVFDGAQIGNSDSIVYSQKTWWDVDSCKLRSATATDIDSVSLMAIPKLYVKLSDSLGVNVAGIVVDSVEMDTTGTGGGATSLTGTIAIWGITEAAVTATPRSHINKGDYLQVATSTGFLKRWNRILATADSFLVTTGNGTLAGVYSDSLWQDIRKNTDAIVGSAIEDFYPDNNKYKDTIRVILK